MCALPIFEIAAAIANARDRQVACRQQRPCLPQAPLAQRLADAAMIKFAKAASQRVAIHPANARNIVERQLFVPAGVDDSPRRRDPRDIPLAQTWLTFDGD